MRFYFWFLCMSFVLISCGGNSSNLTDEEKEQIKQAKLDSIANAKLASIDMNDVDTYPIFKGVCVDTLSKEEQKKCFENHFTKVLHERLVGEKQEVTEMFTDTISVSIKVDNTGKIVLEKTLAKDKTKELLPTLDEDLADNLDEISTVNSIQPATKQGINVATQFTVPIVVNVK